MRAIEDGVHVREDVWKLAPWDETLLWYAKAVAALRAKPLTDPSSWRYQAAIHAYRREWDPLAEEGEALPSAADQAQFWGKCQHGGWYFLPWHRAYLGCFEQIVRAKIVALGGPEAWALPYWNYSDQDNPDAILVRAEFRDPLLPDGTENALATVDRGVDPEAARHGAATGDFGLTLEDVALDCLKRGNFDTPSTSGATSFGGGQTGFAHNGRTPGDLERVPHASVHGGVNGWLGAFNTAGLDPLFWLHHANIDRLWEVWGTRDGSSGNPTDSAWLNGPAQPFYFHDAAGAVVTITPNDVADTRGPVLRYRYESIDDPLQQAGLNDVAAVPSPTETHLVGASDVGISLSSSAASVNVALDPQAMDGAALAGGQTFLNLENVTGVDTAASYRLFLNAEGGAALAEDHFAGLLPLFGVAEASGSKDPHGGSGLNFALDITELVNRLRAEGSWDSSRLNLTFVPRRKSADKPDIKVGRISLYVG